MAFAMLSLEQPIRDDLVAGLRRDWVRLAEPGATWTGMQRISLAAHARAARSGVSLTEDALSATAAEAAAVLGARPASVRVGDVQKWTEAGLDPQSYVELIGVVSRTSAADSIMRGLGAEPEPFPAPVDGSPSGEVASDARYRRAWVPMVGGTSIVSALSLVPSEMNAMFDFHGPAYLTMEQMADPVFTRGLDRAQMELVAARTSALNECFY